MFMQRIQYSRMLNQRIHTCKQTPCKQTPCKHVIDIQCTNSILEWRSRIRANTVNFGILSNQQHINLFAENVLGSSNFTIAKSKLCYSIV